MKKLLLLLLSVSLVFFITSCEDDENPIGPGGNQTGGLIISSTPVGAEIFINGTSRGFTPDTIQNLSFATYSVMLSLDNYRDTTISVTISDTLLVARHVQLTANPLLESTYSDIQLFEQTAQGFSGLKLSTGDRVNSGGADADIFFEATELKSQDQRTPAVTNAKITFFDNSPSSSNLIDGVPSNQFSASTWTKSKPRTQTNYSFLYTTEGNYVKLKIDSYGGGTGPTDPDRWVRVSYKYNETPGDLRFKDQ